MTAQQKQMTPNAAIKSVAGLWLVQMARMAISIAVGILVMRHLGPGQYGVFGVAAACITPFTAFCGWPQGQLVVRELAAEGPAGVAKVQSTAFALRLAGSALQLVLATVAVAFMGYGRDVRLVALATSLTYLVSPFTVLGSVLELDGRFDRVAAIDLTAAVTSIVVRVALVVADASLLWFAAAAIFDAGTQLALYLVLRSRRGAIATWGDVSPRLVRTFLWDGWPMVLTSMALSVSARSDVVIMSKVLGEQEVGWYSAAIRMTEVMYYFPSVISSVYFPTMARRHLDDPAGYYRLITNSCGTACWVGAGIAAVLTVAAPILLPLLLGGRFTPSIAAVQVLAWTIPCVAIGMAFGASVLIERAPRVPLYAAIAAAVVNVAMNLTLIPALGILGGAISGIASAIAGPAFSVAIYRDPKLAAALLKAISPALLVSLLATAGGLVAGRARRVLARAG